MASLDTSTLKTFNRLYPQFIKKYETLIPSANDTITDKINSIIETLNDVGQLTNDVVKNWNTVMQWVLNDGLTDKVTNKIDDMYANGDFTTIIEGSVFTDFNTRLTNNETSLAQKVNQSYVDQQISNIGNASPKGTYATLTALQTAYPTGTTGIYVISGDGKWYYWNGSAWTAGGTYQATAIPDNSITKEKVAFITRSKNLFDKSKATAGSYINLSTGGTTASAGFYYSDYIPVQPNTDYVKKGTYGFAFYDASKVFISSGNSTTAVHTPANCYFVRFTTYTDILNTEQLELGTVSTAYAAYGNTFNDVSIDDTSFQNQLSKSQFKVSQLSNFVKSKNLFNKDTATAGSYINSSGNLVASSGFYYSDYIPVQPSTQYYKVGTYQFSYYDSNKTYISGGSGRALTTPANCYYVRISTYATINAGTPGINLEQLELGTVSTDYAPYYDAVNGLKDAAFIQNPVFITLPPKIYAVVGKELNIYFDNILNDKDTNYDFDIACTIGQQYSNYYRVNPTTAGSYSFTITVYKGNLAVAEANSTIIVSAANVGNAVNRKVLIIGDSTTDNSFLAPHLMSNFSSDVMKITSLGTRGTAPNNHEGHSGWTAAKFASDATSPFVFSGVFNFAQYVSNNGYSGINYVLINLGINDTFWFLDDASFNGGLTGIINNYNTMINSIKAYDANIKIGIALTIPPNYSQDAFGAPYNNDQSRKRYKRNNWLFVKSLLTNFANQEGQNIYIIPINLNLDTRYNYGSSQQAVNANNSMTISFPANNADGQTPGVHPAESGYAQIADSYQYFLKSFEV